MSNKENTVTGNLLFNITLPQFELFRVVNQIFTAYCNLGKNQTGLVSNYLLQTSKTSDISLPPSIPSCAMSQYKFEPSDNKIKNK